MGWPDFTLVWINNFFQGALTGGNDKPTPAGFTCYRILGGKGSSLKGVKKHNIRFGLNISVYDDGFMSLVAVFPWCQPDILGWPSWPPWPAAAACSLPTARSLKESQPESEIALLLSDPRNSSKFNFVISTRLTINWCGSGNKACEVCRNSTKRLLHSAWLAVLIDINSAY